MYQLICPDAEFPSVSLRREFRRVEDTIAQLSAQVIGPGELNNLVGFEVRTALLKVQAGEADAKTRAILFRPALEPILLIHGAKVSLDEFNEIDALAMACSLCGRQLSFRTQRCFGRSTFGTVEFEPLERIPQWCPSIKSIIRDKSIGLAVSAVVFARTIIAHPLSDGNGRLARALSHALLLRDRSCSVVPIALAPAVYAKRDELSVALIKLCQNRDWDGYYRSFIRVLELAIAISEPVRAKMQSGKRSFAV